MTTRYLCPLGCGWSYDEPDARPPAVCDADSISEAAHLAVRNRMAETEAALREHMTEHTAAVILGSEPAG